MKKISSNRFISLIGISSLLGITLACSLFTRAHEGDDLNPRKGTYQGASSADDREAGIPLSACPGTISGILTHAAGIEHTYQNTGAEPEEIRLVTYLVNGDNITDPQFENIPADLVHYQDDKTEHQEIWAYFITLIPLEAREPVLAEYSLMTDGAGYDLALVTQTASDPARWALSVDIADSEDRHYLIYTIIHEVAHLLTLGPDQVRPSLLLFEYPDDDHIYYAEAGACPDYFPGEGCSLPDSYLNTFFTQFWADIHEEWQVINLIEEDAAYYEALNDFYYAYRDRFMTGYAATNPEEDIAESFSLFILSPRPMGESIAEEKILFFYRYPELVSLREQIIEGICQLNP